MSHSKRTDEEVELVMEIRLALKTKGLKGWARSLEDVPEAKRGLMRRLIGHALAAYVAEEATK